MRPCAYPKMRNFENDEKKSCSVTQTPTNFRHFTSKNRTADKRKWGTDRNLLTAYTSVQRKKEKVHASPSPTLRVSESTQQKTSHWSGRTTQRPLRITLFTTVHTRIGLPI